MFQAADFISYSIENAVRSLVLASAIYFNSETTSPEAKTVPAVQ